MPLKLAILGLLMEGDKHPFLIQADIKKRGIDKYVHFQKGSLYYAIKRMEEDGLARSVAVNGDKGKTVYRITDEGKDEFLDLLRKGFSASPPAENPLFASLAFSRFLPPKEIRRILDANASAKRNEIASLQGELERHNGTIPKFGMLMASAALSRMKTDLSLLEAFSAASSDATLYAPSPIALGDG